MMGTKLPETHGLNSHGTRVLSWVRDMGRLPNLIRLGSKLVLEILPSIAATVIGGYLLAQIHYARAPEPEPAAAQATSDQETPTAREERAAMRDVLKARRENPEVPAVVRPNKIATAPVSIPASVPASAPVSTPATTASLPAAMDSIGPSERAATPARTATISPPRARPEVSAPVSLPMPAPVVSAPLVAPASEPGVASVYVPAPPPGLPAAPAVSPGLAAPTQLSPGPTQLSPVVVTTAEPQLPPPPPRGPVGAVLSTFSSLVGHAANATGDTVNWVIDLPGKAISAGGRVIGGSNPPPPAPPPPSRPFS